MKTPYNARPRLLVENASYSVGAKPDEQDVQCPKCGCSLAKKIFGEEGLHVLYESKMWDTLALLFRKQLQVSVDSRGNLIQPGAQSSDDKPFRSWRFCIQLPVGFVRKGTVHEGAHKGLK